MDIPETRVNMQKNSIRYPSLDYRIESEYEIYGPLLTRSEVTQVLMGDRALAVVSAVKSNTRPSGQEIRVVHVPSGEVVFTKAARSDRPDCS